MKRNGHKTLKTIADLSPDTLNANKGTPRGLQMVEDSLRAYGAGRSILADKKGRIIAGNKTLQSASDIDLPIRVIETDGKELVVVQRTDLDLNDPKARELAIADNRAGQVGLEWDADVLAQLKDEGVELSGMFTEKELAAILPQGESKDAEPQIDKAAELQQKWQVRTGEIIQIGRHRIACDDCTSEVAVARLMQGQKADAVLSDPIYGQNQDGVTNDAPETFERIIRGAVKALPIMDGVIVAFQSPRTFTVWLDAIRGRKGHKFERMLWMYKAAQCTFPWRGWILKSESIVVSSCGEPQWQDVHPFAHDCYYLPEVSGELDESIGWHGSVKPLKVIMDLMSRICAPDAAVFDGFVGSGTSLIAAENLNRSCFCMDIDPACVAVTLERATRAFPHLEIKREEVSVAA